MELAQLKANYAVALMEGMDMDMLMDLARDMILENLKDYTKEDILAEAECDYGEEFLRDLISGKS